MSSQINLKESARLFLLYTEQATLSYKQQWQAKEAYKRLQQIGYIIRKLETLVLGFQVLYPTIKIGEGGKKLFDSVALMELYAEAFYYIANRFVKAVSKLPGFSGFSDKVENIPDVRNYLIEHPYGDESQVFGGSMGFGGEKGPVIKESRPVTMPQEKYRDNGVFKNAKILQSKLEQQLLPILKDKQIDEKREKIIDVIIAEGFDIY